MGHTIWVEIHGRPVSETAQDCSTMHRLMDNLDALAGKLGVRKLSDFYDYSELEEEYGDLGDEGDELENDDDEEPASEPTLEERQSKGDWFDSTLGLESVRKLRERLTAQFDDLGFKPDRSRGHWPKQLMDELSHAEKVLSDAASHGQRFRLLMYRDFGAAMNRETSALI